MFVKKINSLCLDCLNYCIQFRLGGEIKPGEEEEDLMTTVFEDQPLALPGSYYNNFSRLIDITSLSAGSVTTQRGRKTCSELQ